MHRHTNRRPKMPLTKPHTHTQTQTLPPRTRRSPARETVINASSTTGTPAAYMLPWLTRPRAVVVILGTGEVIRNMMRMSVRPMPSVPGTTRSDSEMGSGGWRRIGARMATAREREVFVANFHSPSRFPLFQVRLTGHVLSTEGYIPLLTEPPVFSSKNR